LDFNFVLLLYNIKLQGKIVESLEAYDATIDSLKKEMDEFTENAK
jgi:hypothetical protein